MFLYVSLFIIFKWVIHSNTIYTYLSYDQEHDEPDYNVYHETHFQSPERYFKTSTEQDLQGCVRQCNNLEDCRSINVLRRVGKVKCYYYPVAQGNRTFHSNFTFITKGEYMCVHGYAWVCMCVHVCVHVGACGCGCVCMGVQV